MDNKKINVSEEEEDILQPIVNEINMASIASLSKSAIEEEKNKEIVRTKKGPTKKKSENSKSKSQPRIPDPKAVQQANEILTNVLNKNNNDKTATPQQRTAQKDDVQQQPLPENIQKQKLMDTLTQYYTYFPFLEESAPKKISFRDSVNVLEEEISRCKSCLSRNNVLENVKRADIFLHSGIEKFLTSINVPCHGLTYAAKQSQDVFDQELKEIAIKYQSWFTTGPELRYLMGIITRIDLIVKANSSGVFFNQEPNLNAEEVEQLKNKFNNL